MMQVTVNGDGRDLDEGTTVQELVRSLGGRGDGRGVAVALGGEVVPRSDWAATVLPPGSHIEVLTAVQGG